MADRDAPHPSTGRDCRCAYYGDGEFGLCSTCMLRHDLDAAQAEVERLRQEVVLMAERAVVDFDDVQVGKCDAIVPPGQYKDWVKEVFAGLKERDTLRARVGELERDYIDTVSALQNQLAVAQANAGEFRARAQEHREHAATLEGQVARLTEESRLQRARVCMAFCQRKTSFKDNSTTVTHSRICADLERAATPAPLALPFVEAVVGLKRAAAMAAGDGANVLLGGCEHYEGPKGEE